MKKIFFSQKLLSSLLLILFLALAVRVVFLDRLPTGMSDDELLYTLSSRSFFYTGMDVSERWSPFSLEKPPFDVVMAYGRVPYMLFSPFLGSGDFSMFAARLPYAMLGALFTLILFLICQKLFSRKVGIIAALVFALNPWSIFFSRTAYESPIAMYFAFALLALLLYVKSWRILFALPLFLFSFYSYLGTNIILPLFSVITVVYAWLLNKKQFIKYYLILLIVVFAIFFAFLIHLPNDIGGGRTTELLTPNSSKIADKVNWERRESVQTSLMAFFINKYEHTGKIFIDQYLGAFSPSYLFSKGEGAARFTLWSHGAFYAIDIIFLVIGFVALFMYKRKEAVLLLSLLLLAPIPAAIHYGDSQYALRSSFMFPILIIFISYGIYTVLNKFTYKAIPIIVLGLIYALFIANFGYLYFFRNPIYNYDSFGISGRVFAKYAQLAGEHGYRVQYLFHGVDTGVFRQYLFFNNKYNRDNHVEIASLFRKPSISIDNVTFADCSNIRLDKDVITVIPYNLECTKKELSKNIVNIANYTNNQPIYVIYNDLLCQQYTVLPFLNNLHLKDFMIEKLSEKDFCEKFFIRDAGYTPATATESAVPSY